MQDNTMFKIILNLVWEEDEIHFFLTLCFEYEVRGSGKCGTELSHGWSPKFTIDIEVHVYV